MKSKCIISASILIILLISEPFNSIEILAKNNTKKGKDNISLDGITPYGLEIKEEKKIIRRKNFKVEVIYSKILSDNIMGDYMRRFFNELVSQVQGWVYLNSLPDYRMKIIISNCRFCKIGYCKRKNRKEVSLVSYKNNKEDKRISFKHKDIINEKKYSNLVIRAMVLFFGN